MQTNVNVINTFKFNIKLTCLTNDSIKQLTSGNGINRRGRHQQKNNTRDNCTLLHGSDVNQMVVISQIGRLFKGLWSCVTHVAVLASN